jgi:hypothetical protein
MDSQYRKELIKIAAEPIGYRSEFRFKKTGPEGFEPSTYGLEIRCSIQLSYEPHTVTDSLTALRNVEKR